MQKIFNLTDVAKFDVSSTSKGNQIKWLYEDNFIKADTMGYESISEIIASDFCRYISNISFIKYHLCDIIDDENMYYGCYSENFLNDNEECVSFYNILKSYHNGENNLISKLAKYTGADLYKYVLEVMNKTTELDLTKYIHDTLLLDAILLNEDRHFNNLCVIDTGDKYKECPIFDNGLSLLSDTDMYKYNTPAFIHMRNVKAKPFSTKFSKQIEYVLGEPLEIDLKKYISDLENKNIEFRHDDYKRAQEVLMAQCSRLEGKVWVQKM